MATTEFVVEEVAENLEEAASAIRRLNANSLTFMAGGICIGIGVGFYLGQRWRRSQVEQKVFKESEEEVEKIRTYYAQEARAKRPLQEIIEEKGYEDPSLVESRPLPPPVPISPTTRVTVHDRTEEAEKDKNDGWSYPYELARRNWKAPHIIHQDEFFSTEETPFQQTTYVYYAGDDKLTDTDNTVLNNRETLIGTDALINFGHGTDDMNIVYVRNPALELDIEIVRHTGTYEEEVLGLEREDENEAEDETEATDD